MSVFVWAATYGSAVTKKPNVLVAKYGDGYEQRVGDGINTNARNWELTFANRPNATADAIDAFLDARGASESFDWTPDHGNAGKWLCREWKAQKTGPYTRTITATFEETFE